MQEKNENCKKKEEAPDNIRHNRQSQPAWDAGLMDEKATLRRCQGDVLKAGDSIALKYEERKEPKKETPIFSNRADFAP